MSRCIPPWALVALLLISPASRTFTGAQENAVLVASSDSGPTTGDEQDETNIPLAGHSEHGAAYNEGPRQNAYLMGGTGQVGLEVTTTDQRARAFFDQGLGQLYGFWYYEAERSFRRVVALDPDCAMGYWGLAQANIENKQRGASFIKEAHDKREHAGEHEQRYIDALHTYLTEEGKEKERRLAYVKDLESIIREFPADIEARAMLTVHLWQSSNHGLPIVSHQVIDSMLDDIFRVAPYHPAHHFRIHLWDHEEPSAALTSAARCGQAAPGIAHMWHMPGHIYSRLNRFHDAIYQQEASARADHAHMMRDGVLPDQIHNYAHNNEWLIRNLIHVGRAQDALDLAKNMIELPQHPKYNSYSLEGMCSCKFGRQRMLQIHEAFEMWDELVDISQTEYLPATDVRELQTPRLRALGIAHYRRGRGEELAACLNQLEDIAAGIEKDAKKAGQTAAQKIRNELARPKSDPQEKPATEDDADIKPKPKHLAAKIKKARKEAVDRASKGKDAVSRAIAELTGLQLLARGNTDAAIAQFANGDCPKSRLAEYYFLCGDHAKTVELIDHVLESSENQVLPLAKKVDLLRRMGRRDDANIAFDKLRTVAGEADLESPLLLRLAHFAEDLAYPTDWRVKIVPNIDVGDRPELETIGPLRWAPTAADAWTLTGAADTRVSLDDFRGRPVVVIFYLGAGCLHCVEQLHKFAPLQKEFESAGISIVAISTESIEQLETSLDTYDAEDDFPVQLVSDETLAVFKAYRAYDDFEQMPLHGTFLIDSKGHIRWRDISYEPFLDARFLLLESKRLLSTTRETED